MRRYDLRMERYGFAHHDAARRKPGLQGSRAPGLPHGRRR
jgi:hypothetical protein